jgi:hypothetical protein
MPLSPYGQVRVSVRVRVRVRLIRIPCIYIYDNTLTLTLTLTLWTVPEIASVGLSLAQANSRFSKREGK